MKKILSFLIALTALTLSAAEELRIAVIDAERVFKEYYKGSPFTFVVDGEISMKDVVNTNKSLLKVEVIDGFVHVTSVIDNLVKGAAGQAVENMNLLFGLDRTTGLKLKPSGF